MSAQPYEQLARERKVGKLVHLIERVHRESSLSDSISASEWAASMDAGTRRTAEIAADVKPSSAETWSEVVSTLQRHEQEK